MDCKATRIPYRQAGVFSKIVTDYIDREPAIQAFIRHTPSLEGIKQAIRERTQSAIDRETLVSALQQQYKELDHPAVQKNIDALKSGTCFTITTAHQPNILTGPLYFIYKILHAIRTASYLNESLGSYHFVPVYYMGSEDADLDELGHIHLGDKKITWNTSQRGAVGRMVIDKAFLQLVDEVSGQLAVLPFGGDIIDRVRTCYTAGKTIQQATLEFVHHLFAEYGLIVLIPDNRDLKARAVAVFEDELLHQRSSEIVTGTMQKIEAAGYRVQAHPRDINLFYLEKDVRELIYRDNDRFRVRNTRLEFSEKEMLELAREKPEHFSPNVILRGLFQEMILPNVVFIGGGGELAYWLQYGQLFDHYKIPFPVLLVRNSFLLVEKQWQQKLQRIGFTVEELFSPEEELMNRLVKRESGSELQLNGSLLEVEKLYEQFRRQAGNVDVSLEKHVDALKTKAVYRLRELEKKMLRAEKRKFHDQQRQLQHLRKALFPGDGLQERHDNVLYYYAKWGKDLIPVLYDHSLALEQEFVILQEKDA